MPIDPLAGNPEQKVMETIAIASGTTAMVVGILSAAS